MASKLTEFDIAVVGGGMVGAAMATALAGTGWTVAVIEPRLPADWHAEDDYDLRVSAINRASQNLLTRLGVWEDILEMRANPYRRMRVWDARSTGEISFDAMELTEPDLGHIIENRVIQLALLKALEAFENVRLLAGVELKGIEFRHGEVRLFLSNRTRIHARLIIGADGARSRLRELANIHRSRRDYGQVAIVAAVTTKAPHESTAWQRFLSTGPLAFLPLHDGRSSIVWSLPVREADRLMALEDADFCKELGEAFEYRLGEVTKVGRRGAFPLIGGQSYPYVRSRVALVGDAAHSIHPLAGQGVNLGFMDVAELADILDDLRIDPGRLDLLRRYERARRGENEAVMRLMEGFRGIFGTSLPLLSPLRGVGIRAVDRFSPLKRRIMAHALGTAGHRPKLALTPQDAPK